MDTRSIYQMQYVRKCPSHPRLPEVVRLRQLDCGMSGRHLQTTYQVQLPVTDLIIIIISYMSEK